MSGIHPRRWDPIGELRREVGRLFETLEPFRAARPFPPLNLYEAADRFVIVAEMPGIDPSTLDLALSGETLTIRGERKRSETVAEESYRRQERPFGRWTRSVTLPGRVDGEAVSARYELGVLTVLLPRAAETPSRQILVSKTF